MLVTTLTKRMAEDLAEYLKEMGVRTHYLHSEIDTFERIEILRDLRLGIYDVVVGINLLREGLDLPEVSLVAILDADKEGYLRSEGSLIQTIGRAARHVDGQVIMYADKMTRSMKAAIDETYRRRAIQIAHNEEHGITPRGIVKEIKDLTDRVRAVAEETAYTRWGRVKGRRDRGIPATMNWPGWSRISNPDENRRARSRIRESRADARPDRRTATDDGGRPDRRIGPPFVRSDVIREVGSILACRLGCAGWRCSRFSSPARRTHTARRFRSPPRPAVRTTRAAVASYRRTATARFPDRKCRGVYLRSPLFAERGVGFSAA